MRESPRDPHWFDRISRHQRILVIAGAAFVVGVVVTTMRRPNQYSWPGLWAEEAVALSQWASDGISSVFQGLNGNYPMITRILFVTNLELFPGHWVEANAIVAALVVGFVTASLVVAPTVLRGRWLIAAFVLLVPTDAEAFGVLLYSFWWLSLLALLSVLWDPGDKRIGLRVAFGWIGASASAAGAVFGLLGFVRFAFTHQRRDLRVALLTLPASAATLILLGSTTPTTTALSEWSDPIHMGGAIVSKFFGAWVWSPSAFASPAPIHTIVGLVVVVLIVAALVVWRREWPLWVIAGALAGAIAAGAVRVSPAIIHPFVAGPRYFFYPYLLLGMLLVQIVGRSSPGKRSRPIRVGARLLIGVAALNIAVLVTTNGLGSLPPHFGFRRFHPVYDWVGELTACSQGTGVGYFHEGAAIYGRVAIAPETCARLLSDWG